MTIKFINRSFGPGYAPLGAALAEDFKTMADRHEGVSYAVSLRSREHFRGAPAWLKILDLADELAASPAATPDWIVWVDSDVMLLNREFDARAVLEESKDLVVSVDNWGICTGVIAVRNSDWAREFLRAVWLFQSIDPVLYPEYDGRDTWEQNTFKALLRCFPAVRDRFGYMPQSVVQNRCSAFSPQAWLFHFWMDGRTADEILAKRRLVQQNGWCKETFDAVGKFERLRWTHAVSFGRRLGLSAEELAPYLQLSRVTPPADHDDWLPDMALERLLLLTSVFEDAVRRFGDERRAVRWLKAPTPLCQARTPLQLLREVDGAAEIPRLIDRCLADDRIVGDVDALVRQISG